MLKVYKSGWRFTCARLWPQSSSPAPVWNANLVPEDPGTHQQRWYDEDDPLRRKYSQVKGWIQSIKKVWKFPNHETPVLYTLYFLSRCYVYWKYHIYVICVLREFLEFKKIVRRFKDCIKTGDGVRAKKSRYPYPQFSYLENVV